MDEARSHLAGPGGNIDVEGEDIGDVALPGQQLVPGVEAQVGDLFGAAARRVRPRDPFGQEQGQPGRAGRDGDAFGHPVDATGHVGGIDLERDRARVRHVARGGDEVLERHGNRRGADRGGRLRVEPGRRRREGRGEEEGGEERAERVT